MSRRSVSSSLHEVHDPERSALIGTLRRHGITPHKRLGQVFLFRSSVAEQIVSFARINSSDVVVEIGAGLGILTASLANSGARIIGLEYDSRLATYLKRELCRGNVEVERADALNFGYGRLSEISGKKLIIMGNLPYYLTSPLIFRLLGLRPYISRMVLMMQREVADRISARAGTQGYGIISILSQMFFQVAHRLTVLKDCFYPLPAVDSEVVAFTLRSQPLTALADEKAFATLVKLSFAHPRKTLLNAFKGCDYLCRGKERIVEALNAAGIDPMRRAQTVSIAEYARLSNTLAAAQCPDD